MNVLVTGGAGFIGSHVVDRLLARGDAVTVLDDFNDYYDPRLKRLNVAAFGDRARVVEGDIRDPQLVNSVFAQGAFDAVVHLAARAGVRPSLAEPALYVETNVMGTQHLLEAARKTGVGRFVFASSSSVYGNNQQVPFAEDHPVSHPISPYAATKLAGEALAHVYHHLYGMSVVCLRFFTVYGPRQRPDLAIRKFTRAILEGKPIDMYGDGETARDYTYIDDILQGVMAALDRPLGYEIINLGESRTVTLRALVELIEQATGQHAIVRKQPPQPGDVALTYADISKARRLLGYQPAVPIEDGIKRFVAWYRSSNGGTT
jgi:UDP-glucuronate 4-epimerase